MPLMIAIPAGEGEMGSDLGVASRCGAAPAHRVRLDQFDISPEAVSVDLFQRFATDRGLLVKLGDFGGRATNVSWHTAVQFCNWLSLKAGFTPVYAINGNIVTPDWTADGFRLPTEAEWERFARRTGADGSLLLAEWVYDRYSAYYYGERSARVQPYGPASGGRRSIRGADPGGSDLPYTVWQRYSRPPFYRSTKLGFRLARRVN